MNIASNQVILAVAALVVLLVVGVAMAKAQSASGMVAVLLLLVIGAAAGVLVGHYARLPAFVTIPAGDVELPVVWMVVGVTVFVGAYGMVSKPRDR